MGKLYDNKVVDGISKIADVLLIGLYFVICSIPLFTIGASATAMYYAVHKSVFKNRGYTTEFFKSFKSNFKQSTISWVIFLVIMIILSGDIYITRQAIEPNSTFAFLPLFFAILFGFTVMWAIYHFAYVARFTNTIGASFKVSAIIMIANLGWTILMLLLLLVFSYVTYRFMFLLLFAPVLVTCVFHPILEKIFRKYMSAEDLESEDA